MAAQENYYDILGVAHDADAKTIKRAFLKKARQLHPDINKEADAEEKFKKVNEAYSVLSDEQKRANYDRYGSAEGPAGFRSDYVDMSDFFRGSGFDVDDIFSSFFSGGARRSSGAATPNRGRDMSMNFTITLEEAASGCSKKIAYERLAPCDDCNGKGAAADAHEVTCSHCKGTGVVTQVQQSIFGQVQSQTVCSACGGMGKVFDHPCETCQGQGRTPSRERVSVEIPRGIHSGQTMRVAHRGEAGLRGAASGDLLLRIVIAEHKTFERQGDDLFCELTIDSLQAIVGCTKEVQGILPDETVEVHIPSSCEYGQRISVSGKGMPRRQSSARGSLVAVVRVVSPKGLSKADKACIKKLVDGRN